MLSLKQSVHAFVARHEMDAVRNGGAAGRAIIFFK